MMMTVYAKNVIRLLINVVILEKELVKHIPVWNLGGSVWKKNVKASSTDFNGPQMFGDPEKNSQNYNPEEDRVCLPSSSFIGLNYLS